MKSYHPEPTALQNLSYSQVFFPGLTGRVVENEKITYVDLNFGAAWNFAGFLRTLRRSVVGGPDAGV